MDLGLTDYVVWITGASGGIGRALAETFADEGARVALHGNRSFDALESWLGEQPWRDRAMTVRADIRRADELDAAAESIVERFGRIDVTVANAGVWPPGDLRLDELPEERLRDTLEVNLLGTLFTARAFMRTLAKTGPRDDGRGAALAMIGSTAGRFGERGHVDYSASKAALRGVLLTLKNEIVALDPYARVNLVEPGWTVTHMARAALQEPGKIRHIVKTTALHQLARAKDIARVVAGLCSPVQSRHVTGEIVTVSGGMEGRTLWDADAIDEEAVRDRLGDR